jgi:hypothetical protein
MKQSPIKIAKVFISYRLEGEEAKQFLAYKKREKLKNSAEAARKLMLERLDQATAESEAKTISDVRAPQSAKRVPANAA